MTLAPRRAAFCLVLLTAALPAGADGGKIDRDKDPLKGIEYRLLGPFIGGRVARVAGVPGDPRMYYAATASGGVWKSTNGGQDWKPVFDDQPIASIGSIAVAPSDPSVVYVGSGEANIRGNVAAGNGIYKSMDGGTNWTQVWKQEGQIGALAVHPRSPDVAFAARCELVHLRRDDKAPANPPAGNPAAGSSRPQPQLHSPWITSGDAARGTVTCPAAGRTLPTRRRLRPGVP